jgi:hypothetical protein
MSSDRHHGVSLIGSTEGAGRVANDLDDKAGLARSAMKEIRLLTSYLCRQVVDYCADIDSVACNCEVHAV